MAKLGLLSSATLRNWLPLRGGLLYLGAFILAGLTPATDTEDTWRLVNAFPKLTFDRPVELTHAGDVGQKEFEEINLITKGGNYGWRLKEGNRCYNPRTDCDPGNLIAPIHTYPREEGISVTGGVVYRGSRYSALQGKYLYADYGSGNVWALTAQNGQKTANQLLTTGAGTISAFGEDANGEVYLIDHLGTIKQFGH